MGTTLIIDTSSDYLSIGLAKTAVFYKKQILAIRKQSELLVPTLKEILDINNLTFKDLSLIITTIGPGSYTGVRISLTVCKTLAITLKIPLITLSSLASLIGLKKGYAILDAKGGRYYTAYFENGFSNFPTVLKNEDLLKLSQSYDLYGETSLSKEKEYDIIENLYQVSKLYTPVSNVYNVKPNYTIFREMTLDDIKDIAKLEESLFKTPRGEKELNELLNSEFSTFYVLSNSNDILAYYGFYYVDTLLMIITFGVKKEEQNKGLGTILLNKIIENAITLNASVIDLEVRVSNKKALSLYQKTGFKILRTIKNYYENEDGYHMQLQIGQDKYEEIYISH
ncbi:MAG: tRNA (adenosine(37)-N6)-threonylcarbamoyltransferase complex dimerization subunit type 1 TsaB [Bacillales bacterium]|jgi:ribosomal-protein-alanine N-acetyltransferase|nr:tRNA (adenosine(37)-N6)-threonylcarbamoyltransferase complex dimerization subunit type 1 TsaB [Bacillales bacterium]